jgi:hypothetical protein
MSSGAALATGRSWRPAVASVLEALLLCVLPRYPIHAQGVTTAAIDGVVTSADSAVESAEVLVVNLATGERWRASTSRAGRYGFDHLSPGGPYRLEVRAIGFAPVTRSVVTLGLNTRTRVEVALVAQAQVLQPVEVRATADPAIGPERMGPEQVLADSTLLRLPVLRRELTTIIPLSRLATRSGLGVSILGRDPRLTTLEVDGTAAGDLLGGVAAPDLFLAGRPLAVEALQRLEVQPAPYDVRYGSSSAGTVQLITKSGTNRFEGSAWGYYTSAKLQRSDGANVGTDNLTSGEGGMTLGGPIVHDRAAYFLQLGLQHHVVPSAVMAIGQRTIEGRDSTGFTQASARRLRQILLEHYGYDAGTADAFPLDLPAANFFAKVTWQPRVNSRLELSHAYDRSTVDFLADGCRDPGIIYCLTGSHFVVPLRAHSTRLAWTTALGSGAANELVLARRYDTDRCSSADFPTLFVRADAGVLQAGANESCWGIRHVQHALELTDDVTLGLGPHRITLGSHAERIRISLDDASVVPLHASWHFDSLDSLAAAQPSAYEAFGSDPARAGTRAVVPLASELVALYAQDQVTWGRWRATAGLRADVTFGLEHPTFNPTLLDSLQLDNRRTPETHLQWAPRVGLSYDVRGDGRLFLRGGLGWFGGRPPLGWHAQAYRHNGIEQVHIICEGDPAVPTFVADRARQPTACANGSGDAIPGPIVLFERSFRSPHAFKASIGSDARLSNGMVLTADVIYSRGGAQLSLRDRNLSDPLGSSSGEADRPLFGTIDSTAGIVTSRRSGAFERVIALGSRGRDESLALGFQAEQQLGHGATITASYTYTDARDFLSANDDDFVAVLENTRVESPLGHSLRPTAWSAPHRVTLLVAADLPLHVGVTFFLAAQSGSPFTYSVAGDANADGYDNDPIYVPADVRPGGDISLAVDASDGVVPATATAYRTLAAFMHTQPCLTRQSGRLMLRNSCRNPWSTETSARFARTFRLGPRALTVTVDVFNPLNLVSARWGLVHDLSDDRILRLVGYDAVHHRGVYVFQDPDRRQVNVEASRWRMQLGGSLSF